MIFPGPYRIPRMDYVARAAYTNTCGRCAYRGPWMMETVAREQMVDLAARRLGDRSARIAAPQRHRSRASCRIRAPVALSTTASARPKPSSRRPSSSATTSFRREQAAARARRSLPRYRAAGSTSSRHSPSGRSAPKGPRCDCCPVARSRCIMGTGSHGQSLETTMAQVVADELGCDVDDDHLHPGRHRRSSPYGAGTGGSRSAVVAAGGAGEAAVAAARARCSTSPRAAAGGRHRRSRASTPAGVRQRVVRRHWSHLRAAGRPRVLFGHDALPAEARAGARGHGAIQGAVRSRSPTRATRARSRSIPSPVR